MQRSLHTHSLQPRRSRPIVKKVITARGGLPSLLEPAPLPPPPLLAGEPKMVASASMLDGAVSPKRTRPPLLAGWPKLKRLPLVAITWPVAKGW